MWHVGKPFNKLGSPTFHSFKFQNVWNASCTKLNNITRWEFILVFFLGLENVNGLHSYFKCIDYKTYADITEHVLLKIKINAPISSHLICRHCHDRRWCARWCARSSEGWIQGQLSEMVPSSSFVFGIIFQSEILDPILEREPRLPHLLKV